MEDSPKWKGVPAGVLCWHIHHHRLLEVSLDPLSNRAQYIRLHKSLGEQPTRLRLLAPVRGTLPPAVVEAGQAEFKAWELWQSAAEFDQYGDARDRWDDEIVQEHQSEIEALHRKECPDCPWDGRTIFPEPESD